MLKESLEPKEQVVSYYIGLALDQIPYKLAPNLVVCSLYSRKAREVTIEINLLHISRTKSNKY